MKPSRDERFMHQALEEARAAAAENEVPVGAVFVLGEKVLARVRNRCEAWTDPTAHAERIGIVEACKTLAYQRLIDVEVFVTKEPCVMCAGALVQARLAKLVIGADDPKSGAVYSLFDICNDARLNHQVEIEKG
ncbi:MAG: nucleoside deaminase, partial [Planctomycetes bacterium]|nr:nucleoside deaminase [Planctomycetota bacterium]